MKKINILTIAFLSLSGMTMAQSEMDGYRLSKKEIQGTARYMGMAGAFCSLGGDITSLTQNPAGIGIYRNSEVAATFNLSTFATTSGSANKMKDSQMNFMINNVGYVGAFRMNDASIKFLNVGVGYNRVASFNRRIRAGFDNMPSSLTNYIAAITNEDIASNGEINPKDLENNSSYGPYFSDNGYPWLSILGYNAGLIDPIDLGDNKWDYFGFFNPATDVTDGNLFMRESGYIDEYSFNLSGNVNDRFYFGFGLGVTDIRYEMRSDYSEDSRYTIDQQSFNGNYTLANYLQTRGTGVNFKIGIISRLTDNWRVGFTIHTPTYYSLTDKYDATLSYSKYGFLGSGTTRTPNDAFDYNFKTPWQLQVGTSYLFGKKGLISFDYEFRNMNNMKFPDDGFEGDNELIKEDFKASHTFKIGAEYRLSSQLSLRAGYARQTSGMNKILENGNYSVNVLGTAPQYTVDRGYDYFSGGIGYKFGNFFADLTFAFKHQKEIIRPFTYLEDKALNEVVNTSSAALDMKTKSFLLTLGYKF